MINYKNYICDAILLLSMLITGGCSKKEGALAPSNKDENYLVVHDNPSDPIEHAVYELYKSTGVPVFYNDTIARKQVGESAGIPQYFYIRLMVNYSPSTGESTSLSYTLLSKEKRVKSMLDLLQNELLAVLPPVPSVFLTDSLFTPMPGLPIIRDAHAGFNTVAIRAVDPDTMSADAIDKYVMAVLIKVASQKLEMNKGNLLETEFYEVSQKLSPYLDPYYKQLEVLSPDGSQTLEDFGFITFKTFQNKTYSPDRTADVASFLKEAFSTTTNAFNAKYTDYPGVLRKFKAIKKMLTDLKFKLPG